MGSSSPDAQAGDAAAGRSQPSSNTGSGWSEGERRGDGVGGAEETPGPPPFRPPEMFSARAETTRQAGHRQMDVKTALRRDQIDLAARRARPHPGGTRRPVREKIREPHCRRNTRHCTWSRTALDDYTIAVILCLPLGRL